MQKIRYKNFNTEVIRDFNEDNYIIYVDESNWSHGRFRALSVISLSEAQLFRVKEQFNSYLGFINLEEFRWEQIENIKDNLDPDKIANLFFELLKNNLIRSDVLILDTEKTDINNYVNLNRTYIHIFKNILSAVWPSDVNWKIYIDEKSEVNWSYIKNILNNLNTDKQISLFEKNRPLLYRIESISERKSELAPLIMLSDFLVGLGKYSRDEYEKYIRWINNDGKQLNLFFESQKEELSSSDRIKLEILNSFSNICRQLNLGVSLIGSKGLRTRDPYRNINFIEL